MTQRAADNGNTRTLFEITKNISNDKHHSSAAVKDKHGNILTEEKKKQERWREHFEEILNWEPSENPMEITNDLTPMIKSMTTCTEPIRAEEVTMRISFPKMERQAA